MPALATLTMATTCAVLMCVDWACQVYSFKWGHTLAMLACVDVGCVVLGSGLGVKALVGGGQGTCGDTHLQCWHGLVGCVLA